MRGVELAEYLKEELDKVRKFEGDLKSCIGIEFGAIEEGTALSREGSVDGDVLIRDSVVSSMSEMRRSTRSAVSVSRTAMNLR